MVSLQEVREAKGYPVSNLCLYQTMSYWCFQEQNIKQALYRPHMAFHCDEKIELIDLLVEWKLNQSII